MGPLWLRRFRQDCMIAARGYDFREGQVVLLYGWSQALRERPASAPSLPLRVSRLTLEGRRWSLLSLAAIAASLAGCGLSSPTFDDALEKAVPISSEPLPAFRKLVTDEMKGFKEQGSMVNLEISDPRWADHLGGPAWLVCVKFNPQTTSYYYAFYIRKEKVIESRFAVATDHCGQQSFAPFELR
jgi:hypothetical protein